MQGVPDLFDTFKRGHLLQNTKPGMQKYDYKECKPSISSLFCLAAAPVNKQKFARRFETEN